MATNFVILNDHTILTIWNQLFFAYGRVEQRTMNSKHLNLNIPEDDCCLGAVITVQL